MSIEEMIKGVRELHNEVNETVFGQPFRDADTILVDLQEEELDKDATGVANELFSIYEKTSDKKAFLDLFELLVGVPFISYLRRCRKGIKTVTDNKSELVGQIMDQFEDFLEKREGSTEPILMGRNYSQLSHTVTETLQNWGVLPKGGE